MLKLSKEARMKRNEYLREWRRRNPEKVAKYNAKYWENKVKSEQMANGERKSTDGK